MLPLFEINGTGGENSVLESGGRARFYPCWTIAVDSGSLGNVPFLSGIIGLRETGFPRRSLSSVSGRVMGPQIFVLTDLKTVDKVLMSTSC